MTPVFTVFFFITIAILGGYLIDYQKTKLKWQSKNNQQSEEVEDLRKMLLHMKKRIENLEAIVTAEEPSDFTSEQSFDKIEVDGGINTDNKSKAARKAAKNMRAKNE